MKKFLNIIAAFGLTTCTSATLISCNSQKVNESENNSKIKEKVHIAHGGGSIDGHNYSETEEALNESYSKGIRYFELDLNKTSDGEIVAVHDWNKWKKYTNYSGPNEIPTLSEFNDLKILGKYKSLDLKSINQWFKTNSDAVLVTDKIDDPEFMINNFIDPNRMKMELFSNDSIEKAKEMNFSGIMVNYKLLTSLDNPSEFVKNNNSNIVVSSVPKSNFHKKLINNLRKDGIKIYMYFLDSDGKFDEVLIKNLDYIDGFYLDDASKYSL